MRSMKSRHLERQGVFDDAAGAQLYAKEEANTRNATMYVVEYQNRFYVDQEGQHMKGEGCKVKGIFKPVA